MRNLVFIFCILVVASIAKNGFCRKSTVVSGSKNVQFQSENHVGTLAELISETTYDVSNILSEKKTENKLVGAKNITILPTAVKSWKIQNQLQPLIFDLPPPYYV
nr:hypothetical protein [uncultured Draconibacterium sp.]